MPIGQYLTDAWKRIATDYPNSLPALATGVYNDLTQNGTAPPNLVTQGREQFSGDPLGAFTSAAAYGPAAISPSFRHQADALQPAMPMQLGLQAKWKQMGVPAEAIAEANIVRNPQAKVISDGARMYHATSPQSAAKILETGSIQFPHDKNASLMEFATGIPSVGPTEGVSVSRVPRIASKSDRGVTFALDPEKMPPSRPFAEQGYGKTTTPDWPPSSWNDPDLRKMDPHFEFENRTYGKPIPTSAIKEVMIDKSAIDDIGSTISAAEQAGIPVRTFASGREMHSTPAQRFREYRALGAGGSR